MNQQTDLMSLYASNTAFAIRATLPTNSDGYIRFPAKTSAQLILDGESVLPALEISTNQQRAGVDEGPAPDVVLDGVVESQSTTLGHLGTRAQLGYIADTSDVTDIEPGVDPAEPSRVPRHR